MAGLWQRTGNVTVTNGSKTVAGFGTKWKTGVLPIQKGHTFYGPDNAAYEVDTVVSDESILLADTYRGGTLANQVYRIDITRTSTISQFAADLASLVGKYRTWFDGMMTWLTGSGDVSILNPDTGANTTIPSWKKVASEGEGQATRAKVEADLAKTEADRALTEANRAAGIVALAALPMPDVWAPLSDSLRMITGYGREVKVGEDVVARMVNFSRNSTATYIGKDGSLKTAAANEPRFEKEGLLIEGQSQNLVTHSVDLRETSWAKQQSGTGSAPVVTANYAQAPDGSMTACRLQLNKGAGTSSMDYSGVLHSISGSVVGATHTLSVWLKSANQNSYNIALSMNALGLINATITPEWKRFTITAVLDDPNRYPRLQLRGGQGTSDTADILTWGWQQEALPFASSYIPTNGAAATRPSDLLQFVGPGNHPDILSGVPFTFAMRMSCEEAPVGAQRDLVVCPNLSYSLLRRVTNTVRYYRDGTGMLSVNAPGKVMNVVAVRVASGNVCTLRVGSNQASRTETPLTGGKVSTISITNVAGHVRDFRIWQHAVTDEQFKAIA